MKGTPVVSVIIPFYTRIDWLEEALNSVLSQSFTDYEIIVVNDGSKENLDIIREKFKNKIIIVDKENEGPAIARNEGIKKSKGEYIAFLDSDDYWLENKLSLQLKFMEEQCCSFSFTSFEIVDENRNTLNKIVDSQQEKPINYEDMLRKKATLGCSTVILKRSGISKFTMPLIRTGQDYAYWLSILKGGIPAFCLTEPLTQYRILPNSISRNKFKKALRQWEIYRKIEGLSVLSSLVNFSFYGYRAIFRK